MSFIKSLIVEEQCNINKICKYRPAALFMLFLWEHCRFSSLVDNQQKLWLTLQTSRRARLTGLQ